jgi:uncharacterized protein with von Willebrand factor type A (vWA) domain
VADLLTGFVAELRAAGIPVSMVETIDAAAAVRETGLADRAALKTALGTTLVKNVRHFPAFDTAFEVYFGARVPAAGTAEDLLRQRADVETVGGGSAGGEMDAATIVEELYRALRDDDGPLLAAIARLAARRLAGLEPGRPVGGTYYLYRIVGRLGLDALEARLIEDAVDTAGLGGVEIRLRSQEITRRVDAFRAALRDEIRRLLVADRGAEAVAGTLRRPLVEDLELVAATREELAEMGRIVHPLTRKLAVRLAQRRRRGSSGRLEMRRTVRRALSAGGVPLDPQFRLPRPGKPELVILADVSGSMATFARFTLQIVHAMSAHFARVRSFAFVDGIDEVTGFFGPGADFHEAVDRIAAEARVVRFDGHSDYGNAFAVFAERHLGGLTRRSTVIVAGDARTNYHDPNVADLQRIAQVSRALFWINPEARRYWDTGDSVMGAYSPLCDAVHEVRTLRHLEQFVERVSVPDRKAAGS